MGTWPPRGGWARRLRWRRTIRRPEAGRVCFNCRRSGHEAHQCPHPGGKHRSLDRRLADFFLIWKPYRLKRRQVPLKKEGPSETQLGLIRKARECFLTEDVPKCSVAKLKLPDGSTWPIHGQATKKPLIGHLRALPLEVCARVLSYLHRPLREKTLKKVSCSRREQRHLKRYLSLRIQ